MLSRACQACVVGWLCLQAGSEAARGARRHLDRRRHASNVWPSPDSLPQAIEAGTSVAILNPFPWCYEVLFGVVHALQLVVQVVDVYVDFSDIFAATGAAEFLGGFHFRHVQEYSEFWQQHTAYDLVIWTDHYGWEFEERRKKGPSDLLDLNYTGRIWLFNHEPKDVLWPLICDCDEGRFWIADSEYQSKSMQVFGHDQVEWFCVAPHVAFALQGMLSRIGYTKEVHWILPVFPWSNQSQYDLPLLNPAFDLHKGFSIQGNPDAHRRNYSGLLQDVSVNPELMKNPRFELDLFAWKKLDADTVPANVITKIVYKHLRFPEFYRAIHQTLGLMLLFPGDRYYASASSSSIGTAVSVGIPMIVDQRFLEVYSFIPRAAVLVSNSSSHTVAMEHMLALTANEWTTISHTMTLVRETTVLRNMQVLSKHLAKQSGSASRRSRHSRATLGIDGQNSNHRSRLIP